MATRTKTIRIPVRFGNVADIADNTKTSLGTVTIFTPENSVSNPITFISAMFSYDWQNTVNNVDLITFTSFITLAGSSETSVAISGTLVDSGEEMSGVVGPIDFTSYFNTNYGTVTSKDISLSVTIDVASGVSRGVYCVMELTYEFDDSAPTLAQTICIPYEFQGSLGTTQTTIETLNQLTGTGGLISGYSDLSIKYRWLQLKGNTNANNNSTDITLSYSFDSGGTSTLPIKEQGGASDAWVQYQIDTSSLSASATHTFELWSSIATRFSNIIICEWVTYQFTTSGTTQVANYFEYPIEFTYPLKESSTDFSRYSRNIIISEPNVIMENCAVEIIYNTNASAGIGVSIGSQAFTTYSQLSNQVAGSMGLQHRFDVGSAAGSGLTLTHGVNTINVDVYDDSGLLTNITGTVKLLYRSDVSSIGIPSHSRVVTKFNSLMNFNTVNSTVTTNDLSFLDDEGDYLIHGVGLQTNSFTQSSGMFSSFQVQLRLNELKGDGYQTVYSDWYQSDNEIAYTYCNVCVCPFSKLYPQSPQNLINLALPRDFYSSTTTANREGSRLFASYNNITFTLSGTVSGSNGGEIRLNVYRESDGGEFDLYQVGQITGDTGYSFVVYDDTSNYQVVAYEDSTYKGVSKVDLPSTDFDISLASGGGEYGYGFV